MSANVPGIVIVSSSNTKPKSLIKLITKQAITNDDENDPHKITHLWQIDTKYYTAQVNIHGITEGYVRTEEFNNSIEALIIHMDSNKETGLEDLEKWKIIENDCQPDVKILLSNYCTFDTKITKTRAIQWCIKRGFELIELYPNKSKNKAYKDEIMDDKIGVARIVEVLQTHVWSNLIMKDNKPAQNMGNSDISCDENDDFTELFNQLHIMKESIQSMPLQERKQCAEQVVTAFWKAIGGDEEEIADI